MPVHALSVTLDNEFRFRYIQPMGLLTGALFVGWRAARHREKKLGRAINDQNEAIEDLMAELFCCDCCGFCGYCEPENFCPQHFYSYYC